MTLEITNTNFNTGLVHSGQTVDNPIIFYDSIAAVSDFSSPFVPVPTEPATNAWSPDTATFWTGGEYNGVSPPISRYLVIDNPNAVEINYLAIAGHNFYEDLSTYNHYYQVSIEASFNGGSTYAQVAGTGTISATGDEPIIWYFDEITPDLIRVHVRMFSFATPPVFIPSPIISHVKVGNAMVLERREFAGVKPPIVPITRRQPYVSDRGDYLGSVVLSTSKRASINQENNTPTFMRSDIYPFISHTAGISQREGAASETFFYAWRPTAYPDDVVYGWTRDVIEPEHAGGDSVGGRMSWSLSMECIA